MNLACRVTGQSNRLAPSQRQHRIPVIQSGNTLKVHFPKQGHGLPTSQAPRFAIGQGQGRDVVQRGLDRQHVLQDGGTILKRSQFVQRNRIFDPERADPGPPQRGDVPDRADRPGNIPPEPPHIGAGAAGYLEYGVVGIGRGHQLDRLDEHRPRRQIEAFPFPGEVIGPLPGHLDRRIARRNLARFRP